MGHGTRTYVWCPECQRRIYEGLMSNGKCKGCHEDAGRRKIRDITFTEEEYERMGEM